MTSKGCMISAVVVFLLLLAIGGLLTYFIATNWRGWFAGGTEAMITQVINDADIPDSEKEEVKAIVSGLRTDFENEVISVEDFGTIIEGFTESPLIPAVVASESYRKYYDENPDLTDDDKAVAKLEIGRFARGIFEQSLGDAEIVEVLEPITLPAGSNSGGRVRVDFGGVEVTLKQPAQCSVEELRQVTLNARAAADDAGVPNEPFTVDLSDELQKIVDESLGRAPAAGTPMLNTAPATPTPPAPSVDDDAGETYEEAVGETPADPVAPTEEPTTDDGP